MSLTIGMLSLAIAALGIARYFLPSVSTAMEGSGFALGLGIVALLLASFLLAMRLSSPAVLVR